MPFSDVTYHIMLIMEYQFLFYTSANIICIYYFFTEVKLNTQSMYFRIFCLEGLNVQCHLNVTTVTRTADIGDLLIFFSSLISVRNPCDPVKD